MGKRQRVTYRPNKTGSVFGGVVCCVFVVIGIVMVIPIFGVFGVLWTLVAAGSAGMSFYRAFGKKYMGPEIHIEEEGASVDDPKGDPQQRLEQLQSLYDRRLITKEEYEQKRQEILRDL